MVRELLISLAATLLVAGLVFYYLRSRLSRTEQKVDLMFQLIQEHERSAQLRERRGGGIASGLVSPAGLAAAMAPARPGRDGLIEISDNEDDGSEDSYTDGSSVESDARQVDGLEIDDNPLEANIKTISLSLSGAETGQQIQAEPKDPTLKLNEMEDLDEVSDLEDTDHPQAMDEVSSGLVKEEPNPLESIAFHELTEQNTLVDYNKMNMNSLKALAAERNLQNYKKLRKPKLVELLKVSG